MRKIFILLLISISTHGLFSQNITLTPSYAELDGDPSEIAAVIVELYNSGEEQAMTWMRTVNDIPEKWKSSVCDFNLCWAATADQPGSFFIVPADTTGAVHVQFDARDFYDSEYHPAPGCGTVEVVFYSVEDSANYNALGVFHARLGVEETDCGTALVSPTLDNSFLVYPNPAVNTLNAVASFSAHINKIEIVNIVGRPVKEIIWNTSNGKMTFDINEIPQGIYFVRLINDKNVAVHTEKISKLAD